MATINIQPNQEYMFYKDRWQRVRDIIDGEYMLKQRDLAYITSMSAERQKRPNVTYLRFINPTDNSNYNQMRNANYINGARLYNATSRTSSGLFGMAFRVEPMEPDLPSSIEYILDNVDGSGESMQQQCRSVTKDVIDIGRDGLLVDMPRTDSGEVTNLDVENGMRATIQEYKAESIIDWHEKIQNGIKILDLVVLKEQTESYKDEYMIEREYKEQVRVYRLTDEGVTVQLFTASDDGGYQESEQADVFWANNERAMQIPFIFVGSMNNKSCIDGLPMEDIANVNIGHYQENANIASSSFQVSACQPWIADDRYSQAVRNQSESLQPLGEEAMIVLGTGGSFNLTAPPENTLGSKLMKDYEEQMVALGAQLITNSAGNETAEAARIKHASDVSVLDMVASNVSDAYSKAIEYVCKFMGVEYDNYRYELNRNFFETKLTAQEIDALIRAWQAGAISKDILDDNFVKARVIAQETDLEEMNELIMEESGMPNLDAEPQQPDEEVTDGDDVTGTN